MSARHIKSQDGVTIACKQRAQVMVTLFQAKTAINLHTSATGVYIF